ncbi:hypothetical protein THC_1074 [Caldimicrobium thiodismutans]|uniref:DUF4130 domain-containing protein n=1 Tax=Caldimicrobium thiodismutans TaxID=1653476 RepID=A0A0U5AXS4_9BACT|nr:TIGR03915 family putative DNA repair protein [Caldimicrobium thiodismutans]BAU23454.1 hypothetical protein THC_1074 [Caldimicrobium thiodismutans]
MPIYLYDGTWEAFLTLLSQLVFEKSNNLNELRVYNLRLLCRKGVPFLGEKIEVSEVWIEKIKKFIHEIGGDQLLREVYHWYLCDRANIEIPLAMCLKKAEKDPEIFLRPQIIEAVKLQKAKKSLLRERHRWLGFLRFYSPEEGVLFASFEPQYNVLPLLGGHFVKRFPQEKLFIVDTLRGLLFLGQGRRSKLLFLEEWDVDLKKLKDPFFEIWKTYFREIAVPERVDLKRQQKRVPLKVRPFLPEFM